jgi:hypothetical protein
MLRIAGRLPSVTSSIAGGEAEVRNLLGLLLSVVAAFALYQIVKGFRFGECQTIGIPPFGLSREAAPTGFWMGMTFNALLLGMGIFGALRFLV